MYTEAAEENRAYGLGLVFAILGLNVLRVSFDATFWLISFRTATRVRSGVLTMLFKKIARLRSLQDKTVGEVSTRPS